VIPDADLAALLVSLDRDSRLLLSHVLDKSSAFLYTHPEYVPSQEQREHFEGLLRRYRCGEPLAYLIGSQPFWTLDLAVSDQALIPRSETEQLVRIVLQHIPPDANWQIADLGTGSGAIALSIARERPLCTVVATDYSVSALALAKQNAERYSVTNVQFRQGDWFQALSEKYHLIVSNPPYIAATDPDLQKDSLRYEPMRALVSGQTGLESLETLIRGAEKYLLSSGWLLLEHGYDQALPVRRLLKKAGFVGGRLYCDDAGHPRLTEARLV
jgi:release factor glutamine methyltransferase